MRSRTMARSGHRGRGASRPTLQSARGSSGGSSGIRIGRRPVSAASSIDRPPAAMDKHLLELLGDPLGADLPDSVAHLANGIGCLRLQGEIEDRREAERGASATGPPHPVVRIADRPEDASLEVRLSADIVDHRPSIGS